MLDIIVGIGAILLMSIIMIILYCAIVIKRGK